MAGAAGSRVKGLVYTSTLDVVVPLAGCEGVEGETLPYVHGTARAAYDGPYVVTKTAAERAVRAANAGNAGTNDDGNPGGLRTCVLRPTGMYGPRDPWHVGNVLGAARDAGALNARENTATERSRDH